MRKRQLVIGLSLFVALLGVIGGALTWPRLAEAKGQCHKINTTMTSVADFSNFTTAGEIKSGFLKGTTKFTGDPDALTPITSATKPPVKPETFSYIGDLEITTNKGILTTRGVGVFEAVPFGRGTQFDRVIAGTGVFAGANGFLQFNFVADDTGGAFSSSVSGEVCVS
jgi:hypothetical protein